MSGTKESAKKTRDTNLANDPDYYRKIGKQGGEAPHEDGTGFGRTKVGRDGLTGPERAQKLAQERKIGKDDDVANG